MRTRMYVKGMGVHLWFTFVLYSDSMSTLRPTSFSDSFPAHLDLLTSWHLPLIIYFIFLFARRFCLFLSIPPHSPSHFFSSFLILKKISEANFSYSYSESSYQLSEKNVIAMAFDLHQCAGSFLSLSLPLAVCSTHTQTRTLNDRLKKNRF